MTKWIVSIALEWDDRDQDPRTVYEIWKRLRRTIARFARKVSRRVGVRWVSTTWDPRH